MRASVEPTELPPPLPPPTAATTGERKSHSSPDERPLRPAAGRTGSNNHNSNHNNRTFPSGRSSYNLDFVDWENEWETHVGDAAPEGGFEVEENEFDDQDLLTGINWVEEYYKFWESVDNGDIDSREGCSSNRSTPHATKSTDSWDASRIERLHSSIEERGGLPPLRALELTTCKIHERQKWNTEDGAMVTCGICLEEMKRNDCAFAICHPFHVKCIRPWFMRSHECPLCRGDLLQYIG